MKYMLWMSTIMELNSPIFMILSMSASWLVKIFNMYQYNSSASALIELDVTVLAAMCCLVDFNYSSKVINPVDFRSIESNICCLTASSAPVLYSLVSASRENGASQLKLLISSVEGTSIDSPVAVPQLSIALATSSSP